MLYHFPSEPIVLKDLRENALDELRWRLRVPVVRQFGSAAVESFAVVCKCEDCGHVSAGLRGVAPSLFETTFQRLFDFFTADETWKDEGMMPSHCNECGAEHPRPVSAFLAKYLPMLKRDFQITLSFRAGRVHRAALHLMDDQGNAERTSLAALSKENEPPLSVRAAWQTLVSRNLLANACSVEQVAPGYFIGLKPYADSTWSVHGLNQELEQIVAGFEADGFDVFTPLVDAQELELGLSHADQYLNWLGAYASDVTNRLIEPFALVRTREFMDALEAEADRLAIKVKRVGSRNDLMVCFSTEELHVELNLARLLMRIIHTGLCFEDGIVQFFGRELSGIRAGAEAIPLMRRSLPMLQMSMKDGVRLMLTDQTGRKVSCFDVIELATTFDLRNRQEFIEACEQVAPQFPPLMLTLSPHVAGQTSLVVRRIGYT